MSLKAIAPQSTTESALDQNKNLAPCFIGSGTLSAPRDMIRALETLEAVEYRYEIDETLIAEGSTTLVKLMFDADSATMVINGCLFLNAASFKYLDFETIENNRCVVRLFGEGTKLTLTADSERDVVEVPRGQLRLLEDAAFDASFVMSDDEDDDFE